MTYRYQQWLLVIERHARGWLGIKRDGTKDATQHWSARDKDQRIRRGCCPALSIRTDVENIAYFSLNRRRALSRPIFWRSFSPISAASNQVLASSIASNG